MTLDISFGCSFGKSNFNLDNTIIPRHPTVKEDRVILSVNNNDGYKIY
jgi:hypothetical protein